MRIPHRECSACHKQYPETPEFFAPHAESRGGLRAKCRKCQNSAVKRWRHTRVIVPLAEKPCMKCKKVLACTEENFYPKRSGKGGFSGQCKGCISEHFRARYYGPAHEQILDGIRASSEKNRAKWVATRRTKNWASDCAHQAKHSAARRGFEYAIDTAFVLELFEKQKGLCYWFRIPIVPSGVLRDPQRPSLDRLDNTRGYVRDNLVLTCMAANMGRSESTAERFAAFCQLLRSAT